MSQDYPSLALDELVLMSPSPAPQTLLDDSDIPTRTKSASPESLPESDIVQMRRKVVEMRHVDKFDAELTSREKELAEMVLRLTTVVRPDQDQLLRQADVISALMQQRDLLLHQAEEQRLRWSSERDNWARMAEALLAQKAKNRLNPERDEDLDRLHLAETDNKDLRQRLNETHSRLQMLESELTRLRPLLLMQPLISRSSMPPPTPNPKTQYAKRRKKDSAATEDEHGPSEDEPQVDSTDTPSYTHHSQPTPRAKTRKSEALNSAHPLPNAHKRRPSQKTVSRGLSADARVEHLLLAARKIGKHRAGIMSGMVQHFEDRERERRREESATTAVATAPKTPKRNMSYTGYPPEGGYVYLNGQMRPGPGMQPVPVFIPAYPGHILQTPSSSTTAASTISSAPQSAQKPKQDARTNNPQTPLDSLLSAARSMMREDVGVDDEDEDEEVDVIGESPGRSAGTRLARSREARGSPVPRRRKVPAHTNKLTALHERTSRTTDNALASSVNAGGTTNIGAGRVKSALDVLADQAAAFSTQEQCVGPSQTQTPTQGKGKEKESADTQRERSSSTPKLRGRAKLQRKELDVDTPSSIAHTSRSRTPRSDRGDERMGSTQTAYLHAGGSTSEDPVDPGGGTNGTSTSNPSSQTLDSTFVAEGSQATVNDDARSSQPPNTPSSDADDLADATPRQGSHVQRVPGEEGLSGTDTVTSQPSLAHLSARSVPENECREGLPQPQRSEVISLGGENDGGPHSRPMTSIAPIKNRKLVRVAEQDLPAPAPPTKRQRSPYVKWSKEEDDLLAKAVAKYGQKWDLVQKALPSRGYHQVRQRWLRKLGVFDSKPDLSSFQTAATTFPSAPHGDDVEPRGNPKLGLAPLSSERAFSGLMGRPPSLPS